MTHDAREVLVGVLAILGVSVLLAFVTGGKPASGNATAVDYTLNATFNKVDGLQPGAEVRMGGIRVGTVENYKLDPTYRALMTIRIKSSVKLPTDSAIGIHTDGLFGVKFVVLDPGGEEEFLKPGAEIEYTQDPMIVSDLLELIIVQGRTARDKRIAQKNAVKADVGAQGDNKGDK